MLILVNYVDDVIMASNDEEKSKEVEDKLGKEFELVNLGEPKEFLSIQINHDKRNNIMELYLEKFITRMLTKFGFNDSHPQRTPMNTLQVTNRER